MKKKFYYAFYDEPVRKFCYDIQNQKIEVHFSGYYNTEKDVYIEKPCVFIIERWRKAKSRLGREEELFEINKHIGVFRMILSIEFKTDELIMLVNTIDNRYVTLFFEEPNLILK